jgi:hypothetical protein
MGPQRLRPETRLGRWSMSLLAGSLASFVVFFLLVGTGQRGGDTFFSNVWLAGAILLATGLTVSAGVIGLLAIIKEEERSLGVLGATALGTVTVLFVIGEIAFPH